MRRGISLIYRDTIYMPPAALRGLPRRSQGETDPMNRRTTVLALGLAAAGTLVLAAGCKKKPPTTTEAARPAAEAPVAETRVAPPPATRPAGESPDVLSADLQELNR